MAWLGLAPDLLVAEDDISPADHDARGQATLAELLEWHRFEKTPAPANAKAGDA
jgi:hypothetical protein